MKKSISFQNPRIIFYLTIFVSCCGIYVSSSPNVSTTPSAFKCLPDQSTTLLQFKQEFSFQKPNNGHYYYLCSSYSYPYYDDFTHPHSYPKMKFWNEEEDCCSWDGVTCDMKTGQVVGLDLSYSWLQGPLRSNSSLFKLHQLQEINLAYNNFSFSKIPSEFGQFSRLTYLKLSMSMFSGQIPSEISYLTNLDYLGLSSFKNYDDTSFLYLKRVDFTRFIQNMTNLRTLSLHQVNLSSSIPESLTNLSSLTQLQLSGCGLYAKFPEKIFQFPKLEVIYVPCNYRLTGFLPQFHNSSSLMQLNLDLSKFSGKLPDSIGQLESLIDFDIWKCNFEGPLPSSIWNLSNLNHLDLSSNHLNSHELPSTLGNLAKLGYLSLSSAQLSGEVPSSLGNLTQLKHLDISYNNLSLTKLNTISDLPKFQTLILASCNLSEFPSFLKNQDQLEQLDLSDNRIEGQIPKWFWGVANKNLDLLGLSGNKLQGTLNVPPLVISFFDISKNNFTGKIHPSFRNWTYLKVLDLSENHFSGTIPQWLGNFCTSLEILNLRGNNFHGSLPRIFTNGSMHNLKKLDLSNNQLQGKVPQFLINCSKLQVLNLGDNQISDTFPFLIKNMPELQVLVLRQNKFYGPIWHPRMLWGFESLHIMDLSFNNFSGSLPSEYFINWVGMIQAPYGNMEQLRYMVDRYPLKDYSSSMTMINKGLEMKFKKILTTLTCIDLSNNRFDGEIPSTIGNLQALVVLNLSSNSFTGLIPPSLGNMSELESLDLSKNKLSGRIPQQLTNLTFLEYLNLSQNQLTGPIPRGRQFDTFSSSSFDENPGLCGSPLSRNCENVDSPIVHEDKEEEPGDNGFTWKPVAVGYGFGIVVGFIIGHVTLSQRRSNWFRQSFVGKFIYAAC